MATTIEMDPVIEPPRADDELPATKLSSPHIAAKVEQIDDDVEMTSHTPALQDSTESFPVFEQKPAQSPPSQRLRVDQTSLSETDVSHPNLNGVHEEYNGGDVTDPEDTAEDTQLDTRTESLEDAQEDTNEETTEDNNEELTPPPDSPIEDTMSRTPSVPPNALQDEIVVGTKAHAKSSPTLAAEPDDVVMGDAGEKPLVIHHAKRKRASGVYAEPDGSKSFSPAPAEEPASRRPARPSKAHGMGGVKGALLGFWRDSPAENEADKHAVIGFIDVRDRLRTRILPSTRDGRPVDQRYPIPPGPGGSWVTFDRVAFDSHLVGLDQLRIKEYVRIREEEDREGKTPEENAKLDRKTVELARAVPLPDAPVDELPAHLIAHGPKLPANLAKRPVTKKRRVAGSLGAPSQSPAPVHHPLEQIQGTRPTRILLGYWKQSSEKDPKDKHAVFGILGANDMFRVKLTRETRDGRTVIGNFPQGAGALWIHWDEVEFDPHLNQLSRAEVKEYCRIRQRQLDLGEAPQDRVANETKAVYEAQQRVAQSVALGTPFRKDDVDLPPIAMKGSPVVNGSGREFGSPNSPFATPKAGDEPRLAPRPSQQAPTPRTASGRHPLPDLEFRAANRPPPPGPSSAALERTNSLARREIARLEAAQARADLRAASREASVPPPHTNTNHHHHHQQHHHQHVATTTSSNGSTTPQQQQDAVHFQDNVSRLNKVWEAQEAHRIRAGGEDAKMYGGVKYQRKQNGPFQGKLVSQGTIITIDGEDYVEYRVLTKPTFF